MNFRIWLGCNSQSEAEFGYETYSLNTSNGTEKNHFFNESLMIAILLMLINCWDAFLQSSSVKIWVTVYLVEYVRFDFDFVRGY